MAIIVEDGTAPEGANSYASESDGDDYFDTRANATWADSTADKEAALIRATAALDAIYRTAFPGYKTHGRDQSLEWPRSGAYDYDGQAIEADEIPNEIIQATIEIAMRELASPGSMMPDLDRGGNIKMLKASSVVIEYGANATVQTSYTLIDGILSGILGSVSAASFVGTAVRG